MVCLSFATIRAGMIIYSARVGKIRQRKKTLNALFVSCCAFFLSIQTRGANIELSKTNSKHPINISLVGCLL